MEERDLRNFKADGVQSVTIENNGIPNTIVFNFDSRHQLEIMIDDTVVFTHWIPDPEWLITHPPKDSPPVWSNSYRINDISLAKFGIIL